MAQKKCGAKTTRGTECQAWAMRNGRCRVHGGASPCGPDSPNWRHGRYSKYVPKGLLPQLREAVTDPEMLSLRSEIGLVQTRMESCLAALTTGETGRIWRELKAAQAEQTDAGRLMGEAQRAGDAVEEERQRIRATDAARKIRQLIDAGDSDQAKWSEIQDLAETRRKLVESESRRLVQSQQTIALTQVHALLDALVSDIREVVSDPRQLVELNSRFVRRLGFASVERVDGGN